MTERPAAAVLLRWIESGGHWEVLAERGDLVTVGLFTCDGGEEMDRLTLARDTLRDIDIGIDTDAGGG